MSAEATRARVTNISVELSSLQELVNERDQLLAENARMAEALRPFALLVDQYEDQTRDALLVWISKDLRIDIGMLVDARDAMPAVDPVDVADGNASG